MSHSDAGYAVFQERLRRAFRITMGVLEAAEPSLLGNVAEPSAVSPGAAREDTPAPRPEPSPAAGCRGGVSTPRGERGTTHRSTGKPGKDRARDRRDRSRSVRRELASPSGAEGRSGGHRTRPEQSPRRRAAKGARDAPQNAAAAASGTRRAQAQAAPALPLGLVLGGNFDEECAGFHVTGDASALERVIATLSQKSPSLAQKDPVGLRWCSGGRRGPAVLLSHPSFTADGLCASIMLELAGDSRDNYVAGKVPKKVVIPTDAGPLRVQLAGACRTGRSVPRRIAEPSDASPTEAPQAAALAPAPSSAAVASTPPTEPSAAAAAPYPAPPPPGARQVLRAAARELGVAPQAEAAVLASCTVAHAEANQTGECGLCSSAAINAGELAVRLPCRHRYHGRCLMRWLAFGAGRAGAKCPACRASFGRTTGGRA